MSEIVYRVAHKTSMREDTGTHWGPYATCGMDIDVPDIDRDLTDFHPTPWEDRILNGIRSDEVCGFDSLDQMFAWFCEREIEELDECNFHVQVWDVTGVRFGSSQVVFSPSSGQVVDTIPFY